MSATNQSTNNRLRPLGRTHRTARTCATAAATSGVRPTNGVDAIKTKGQNDSPRPAPHKRPPSTAVQIDYTVLHKYATEQELSYNELCATVRAALRTK